MVVKILLGYALLAYTWHDELFDLFFCCVGLDGKHKGVVLGLCILLMRFRFCKEERFWVEIAG